ncbi:unnamed protein product [Rhizophagus irregularis]|uniref:HMG box domain-containing protein n=2 Tax=Rhizophagus irregularis TaxID=588596 RepID=A0A2I1H885_9GLOM|nr:hypothetical protein RhiirA4_548555 [Rhizophagus irregularis]CAB4436998.1 unnamed protein product [Rhizophagus irregularis]CAB4437163.1 unnamed protein product [Rhizophagus irregularis]
MTSRACVFINSNPKVRNKLINTISCIKPKFPPNINLRELITKQTYSESSRNSGRSPNAFIIYRKAFVEAARKDGYHLPMTVVSSMASRSWDLEPGEVKEHYKRLAKEANAIRNKLVPKLNKKRRQKWNIVSFPPPTSSVTNNKTRSKKKKVEIKENPSSSTGIPPISFHIPYDICSKIEDRYSSLDDSTILHSSPSITNSAQQQPQQVFNFNDIDNFDNFNNFNNFINYIPQQPLNQELIIGEQIIDTFNVAIDIPIDINNEFEYDSFGFSTLFNEYYPSILGG